MKKIFKKNYIIITVLALLIGVAGYLNCINNMKDNETVESALDTTTDEEELLALEPGSAVLTSVSNNNNQILSELKIQREQNRADAKENLYKIIDNDSLEEDSKKSAIDEIVKMNDISEREMACELLLNAKGYGEAIVTIIDDSVDVVINATELSEVERIQIEDIITRKANTTVDKIVISPINDLQ